MARPSKMGAGYDAWVLGLHATHVRVCTRALVCRGQGKGWVRNGAAHVIKRGSRVVQTTRPSCRHEGGQVHLRSISNELVLEKVQPAAFT